MLQEFFGMLRRAILTLGLNARVQLSAAQDFHQIRSTLSILPTPTASGMQHARMHACARSPRGVR